jgi:proline dehydrogenase
MAISTGWQRLMINAATSPWMKRAMTTAGDLLRVGHRFAGRSSVPEAVAVAGELCARGLRVSLFHLGEYARDAATVEDTVQQTMAAARVLGEAGLDAHVSIDPTSLGFLLDEKLGRDNACRIGEAVLAAGGGELDCLMLDMEDYSMLERTLALERELARNGIPVGVTLQAYLHRTGADLASIVRRAGYVLLVKGAFAEREPLAWEQRSAIDANYLALAGTMLAKEVRDTEFYPAFGTHDERLIRAIQSLARRNKWVPGSYEFEFLYGVRPKLARALVAEGECVRLYLPFGTDWWPYVARRIGENPRYVRNLIPGFRN